MAEPDAVPQKPRAGRIAGPKKRPRPRTFNEYVVSCGRVGRHENRLTLGWRVVLA